MTSNLWRSCVCTKKFLSEFWICFAFPGNFKGKVNNWNVSMWTDPLGRPTVRVGSDHCFRTCCLYVHFSKSSKTRQISSENNVHYWRDCGSSRVDHWFHLSCNLFVCILEGSIFNTPRFLVAQEQLTNLRLSWNLVALPEIKSCWLLFFLAEGLMLIREK